MTVDKIPSATELHYHLKCKVVVKEVTYEDHQSKGVSMVTDTLVHLVPVESTQRDLFLMAWLPDTQDQTFEIGLKCAFPIYGVFRGCIKRANKVIDRPHIFVMSRGAEEELKALQRAHPSQVVEIDIEVLGEHEDDLLDNARDYELPNKKEYDRPDLTSKDAY